MKPGLGKRFTDLRALAIVTRLHSSRALLPLGPLLALKLMLRPVLANALGASSKRRHEGLNKSTARFDFPPWLSRGFGARTWVAGAEGRHLLKT
jgi:hypothetical protein